MQTFKWSEYVNRIPSPSMGDLNEVRQDFKAVTDAASQVPLRSAFCVIGAVTTVYISLKTLNKFVNIKSIVARTIGVNIDA